MKPAKKLLPVIFLSILSVALSLLLVACGGNPLQEAVDEINSDEAMHAELDGLYKVHAEAQGESTIKVVFRAELEELATSEISQLISDEAASEFLAAVDEMRKAGISEPAVVLEFLDLGGNIIYVRTFN